LHVPSHRIIYHHRIDSSEVNHASPKNTNDTYNVNDNSKTFQLPEIDKQKSIFTNS